MTPLFLSATSRNQLMAWLHGESYVTPQKVAEQFPYVVTQIFRLMAAALLSRIIKENFLT